MKYEGAVALTENGTLNYSVDERKSSLNYRVGTRLKKMSTKGETGAQTKSRSGSLASPRNRPHPRLFQSHPLAISGKPLF